jgi:hypothetical protein
MDKEGPLDVKDGIKIGTVPMEDNLLTSIKNVNGLASA